MKAIAAKRKKLLNISEAAANLGIHRDTLSKLMRANCAPPHLTLGKRRYFARDMLDQWIKARSISEQASSQPSAASSPIPV